MNTHDNQHPDLIMEHRPFWSYCIEKVNQDIVSALEENITHFFYQLPYHQYDQNPLKAYSYIHTLSKIKGYNPLVVWEVQPNTQTIIGLALPKREPNSNQLDFVNYSKNSYIHAWASSNRSLEFAWMLLKHGIRFFPFLNNIQLCHNKNENPAFHAILDVANLNDLRINRRQHFGMSLININLMSPPVNDRSLTNHIRLAS